MAELTIRFDDGAAYEEAMGRWSVPVGQIFIDWLAPQAGLRWIDVGCGNGAFTGLVVQRCAPAEVQGIDPSEAQLAFARRRPEARGAIFSSGDAMALPFDDNRFDAAVMALVIFFVPDPAKGVAEMARVVRPGGTVATYAWDVPGDGSPVDLIRSELRGMGVTPPPLPSCSASSMSALRDLWTRTGLEPVETREITVQRTFADFDDFWTAARMTASVRPTIANMPPDEVERLKQGVRAHLAIDAQGRVTHVARANAVKGRVQAEGTKK